MFFAVCNNVHLFAFNDMNQSEVVAFPDVDEGELAIFGAIQADFANVNADVIVLDGGGEASQEENDVVHVRIKNFIAAGKFPSTVKGATLKDLKRTSSFLNECGVRLMDENNVEYFVCMLDPCFNVNTPVTIKCTKSGASNATHHMDKKHGITSAKTQATQRKVDKLQNQLDMFDQAFKRDPMRWFQCGFATWSAEQSIPYNAFNTTHWRLLACQLPVGAGGMQFINMRKHHIELYETCKRTIVSSIKSARDTFTIPFLSLYLDLIKSKASNQKFIALRVCFNALEKVNLGYNLVVRRFAPTTQERQECQLSAILTDWVDGILKEFDIDILRDILTSCSDSGSNVKRALDVLIDAWWEWCISHLSHLALTDAFGTSIDPAKSRNVAARKFFKKIKKVIEATNKSELLGCAFEAAMMEIFATYLKLINSPQHRWSATALVLERLLICWDAMIKAFRDLQRPVPLTDSDRTLCIEFYSIIEPVRALQSKAQAMQLFVIIDVYIMLYTLITTTLDLGKPLELLQPVRRQLGIEPAANISRPTDLLQQPTCDARALLLEAMSQRFFNRYHPIFALRKPEKVYGQAQGRPRLLKSALVASDLKFSYLIDAQSMLFPPMTSGMILKKMINAIRIDSNDVPIGWTIETLRQQHFDFIVQFIWSKISNLAEQVAASIRR